MTVETWETVEVGLPKSNRMCVHYSLKHANIKLASSNVAQELNAWLQKVFVGQDLSKTAPNMLEVYFITQLASTHSKLRFVVGGKKGPDSITIDIDRRKAEAPEEYVAILSWWSVLKVDTETIAKRLRSERMVFTDSSGRPTKKPVFEIGEEGDKITITAPIMGISDKEFDVLFRPKSKKSGAT